MKKEIGPVGIIVVLILAASGIGLGVYLLVRPEPINVRKGVPWEDRMKRGGAGEGATMGRSAAPPVPSR